MITIDFNRLSKVAHRSIGYKRTVDLDFHGEHCELTLRMLDHRELLAIARAATEAAEELEARLSKQREGVSRG